MECACYHKITGSPSCDFHNPKRERGTVAEPLAHASGCDAATINELCSKLAAASYTVVSKTKGFCIADGTWNVPATLNSQAL